MKIVKKDNFDRENVSEEFIAIEVDEYIGKEIVRFLNDRLSADYSEDYFELVSNDYKLYLFKP